MSWFDKHPGKSEGSHVSICCATANSMATCEASGFLENNSVFPLPPASYSDHSGNPLIAVSVGDTSFFPFTQDFNFIH